MSAYTEKYRFGKLEEKTHFRCDSIRLSEHGENKIIYVNLGLISEFSIYIKNICDLKKDNSIIDMPGDIDTWYIIIESCVKKVNMENIYNIRRDILFFTLNKICFDKTITDYLLNSCIASNEINKEETQWNLLPDEYLQEFVKKAYAWYDEDDDDDGYSKDDLVTEYIEKNSFAVYIIEQCNLYDKLGKELQNRMEKFSNPVYKYEIIRKK